MNELTSGEATEDSNFDLIHTKFAVHGDTRAFSRGLLATNDHPKEDHPILEMNFQTHKEWKIQKKTFSLGEKSANTI